MMIIEGAFRVHNFLVDYREEMNNNDDMVDEIRSFEIQAIEDGQLPIISGNDSGGLGGRISTLESVRRSMGENKRNQICHDLYVANKSRK